MARHNALVSLPLLSLWRARANAFLTAFALLASSVALGQAIPQFSTVEPHQYDTINLATLGIQLNVPVRSKAGHIPFSLSLTGTSQVVLYTKGGAGFLALPTLFAQESHLGQLVGFTTGTECSNMAGTLYSGFYFTDSLGNTHQFLLTVSSGTLPCGPTSDAGYAQDSSGLYMSVSTNGGNSNPTETVTDVNGNVLSGAPARFTSFTDPNKNSITTSGGGYTDTLSQTAITVTGNVGTSQTATWTDALNNNQSVSSTMTSHTLDTAFGCSYDDPTPSTQSFPTSVSFPDTSTMSFTWEKTYLNNGDYTGRLASITLPTGGLISYAYSGGTNGINCYDGTPATMTRTTPDGAWTYTHTTGSGVNPVTTVTDPLGNNTVYTFADVSYQIEKQVYNGSAVPANLIETVITCYNNTSSTPANCNSTYGPVITEKDEYTTYPGVTGYSAVKTAYNSFGLVTDVKMFDFNATTPTNEKQIVYGSGSPTQTCTAVSARIVAKPCVITLYDSQNSNAILSQTWNTYDTSGNLLQTWNRVSGSGGTGTYLSKSYTYTNGVVQTMTDVNGEVMNYTTTSCNNMFVTSQFPAGFTNLKTSQIWDCNGGVVTSSTDANGQNTYTNYYVGTATDQFYRPLQDIDEESNITSFTYHPTTVDSTFLFGTNNSSVIETLSTTDSIGRPAISQLRQGPGASNWDTKSRTFDADGHVYETSLPCVQGASTACSASTESQTYDALNRPRIHTGTGGDVVTKVYIGQDVTTTLTPAPTGENAKETQKEYDGLGRLKSVCVISGAPGSGPCGQTNGGTGFLTTYTYDGAGRLLQTVENAQVSSPRQARSYTYDLLGRMLTETNPESGTTTYTYDTDPGGDSCASGSRTSLGDLLKKVDANGHYVCYIYDALHRVTDVGNSLQGNPASPCRRFRYDSASNGVQPQPPSSALTNLEGRLVEVETDSGSTITDEWISYDQRGQQNSYYQKSPNSGSVYYNLNATYWADKSLNTVSGVGLPIITYGGLDGEGRVQTVSASGTNPVTGVIYNNGSYTTGPVGSLLTVTLGTGDTQNFTYALNTGRMTSYSASVGSPPTVISGAPQWSPNGTLLSNTISDGYNSADTQVCSYLYDDFIRVAGTSTTPGVNCLNGSTKIWNQTFTYGSDAFGNLTKTSTGPGLSWACAACYNTANNQYNSTLSASIAYDLSGNLLNDTFHSYTWDAYGHVSTIATPPNGSTTSSVVYDANGNKVEENVSGTIHEYVSAFGVTAQMTGQTEGSTIVPLPGGVQALYYGGVLKRFRFPDWQGSIRAESDPVARAFTESLAFAPFGERYALKGAPYNVDSFTGKPDQLVPDEYDFPAREEHNGQGRWVSPDPMRGTGNKYVYADNNPLSKVDIYGMYTVSINGIDTSVDGAIEAAAFSIAESHPTFAVQVGSQTTASSSGNSSSSDTQTAASQQQNQTQLQQQNGQPAAQQAQNTQGKVTPTNQPVDPVPTGPEGKPTPPPVPVPGCPTCDWVWVPDKSGTNDRGGQWRPDNYPSTPGGIPDASWDTGSRGGPGHWDVNDGNKNKERYYPDGRSMPVDVAHPPDWRPQWPNVSPQAVRQVTFWGTVAAAGAAIIQAISELGTAF